MPIATENVAAATPDPLTAIQLDPHLVDSSTPPTLNPSIPARFRLGIDIWEIILQHVKRPLPRLGAPVGRKGWHQGHLATCMRVSKLFNSLCWRLLYTDPVVSDLWSFAFGADTGVSAAETTNPVASDRASERCSKLECLAHVKRVFFELPDWETAVPNDDWVDLLTPAEREKGNTLLSINEHKQMLWCERAIDGATALLGLDAFRPARIVFEAFYDVNHGYRPYAENAVAAFAAYADLLARIEADHVCCWTGQSLLYIAQIRDDGPCKFNKRRGSWLTKHVGTGDDDITGPTDLKIRFRSPWLGTHGAAEGVTDEHLIGGFRIFLWHLSQDVFYWLRQDWYDTTHSSGIPNGHEIAPLAVDIYPFFPSLIEPGISGVVESGSASSETSDSSESCDVPRVDARHERNVAIHDPDTVSATSPNADPIQGAPADPLALYAGYERRWQEWCDSMMARYNRDGRCLDLRLSNSPACEACGDCPPDPYAPSSARVYDPAMARLVFPSPNAEIGRWF